MHPQRIARGRDGMIGMYGFAVEGTVAVFGESVDHVCFVKDRYRFDIGTIAASGCTAADGLPARGA